MAAPTRNLFGTATTGTTNSDTLTVAMATAASGAQVGDVVEVFVASDGVQATSVSSGAGWSKVTQQNETGTSQVNLSLFRFTVATAGTIPDLVVDMGATTEMAVAHWFRLRPSAGNSIVALTPVGAQGSSTNPNPAAISNASGSARDTYFIAAWGGDGNNVVSSAAPASYGNHQSTGIANNAGASIGSADRTISAWANAASEDPGAFTRATEQWATLTVAYYETLAARVAALMANDGDDAGAGAASASTSGSVAANDGADAASSAAASAITGLLAANDGGDAIAGSGGPSVGASATLSDADDSGGGAGAASSAGSAMLSDGNDQAGGEIEIAAAEIVAALGVTDAQDAIAALVAVSLAATVDVSGSDDAAAATAGLGLVAVLSADDAGDVGGLDGQSAIAALGQFDDGDDAVTASAELLVTIETAANDNEDGIVSVMTIGGTGGGGGIPAQTPPSRRCDCSRSGRSARAEAAARRVNVQRRSRGAMARILRRAA